MDEQNKKDEIEEIFSYYGRQRDKNSQEMIVALLRELQEVSGCMTPDLKCRVCLRQLELQKSSCNV